MYFVYKVTPNSSGIIAQTETAEKAAEICIAKTLYATINEDTQFACVLYEVRHGFKKVDSIMSSKWSSLNVMKLLVSYGLTMKQAYELTEEHLHCFI